MKLRISPFILCALLMSVYAYPLAAQAQVAEVASPFFFARTNGTLVKAESDPRVFLLDQGKKRWIESGDIFIAQGFQWNEIVTISAAELATYPDGTNITSKEKIILSRDIEVLPDLIPLAATDLILTRLNGRRILRFTATFWNQGKGTHELIARGAQQENANGDQYYNAFQHILHKDGTTRDVGVGSLFWHDIHNHYHYDNFATYELKLVKALPGGPDIGPSPTSVTEKSTFCMRDDVAIDLTLPGAPKRAVFGGCGSLRQGVSIGWADKYPQTLPDQYFDVNDLPAGIYQLSFAVDPLNRFLELSRENNHSAALIQLDPAKGIMKLLASGAAYSTSTNRFPDGMLIRAEGDSKVYVIKNNKKRLLSSPEIFASYGYTDSAIYTLPVGIVNAIPRNNLVRVQGTAAIYAINENGFRRHIMNPTVFSSYGFTGADVADISATEFAGYRDTDLVTLAGDNEQRVYSMSRRSLVGSRSSLTAQGLDPASVHVINSTDLAAYAVTTVAENLQIPWDIVFLPDGDMLVTERVGTLRRIGKRNVMITLPAVVKQGGEGGLMGMALHPNFATNQYVYLYFTTDINGKSNRVERFRLVGDTLIEDKVIIADIPAALYHDGGQIAFGPDGMLYITTGDADVPNNAQDLKSLAGKTLRLTAEGVVPSDNPFGTPVWSYGHRNAQGIAWDSQGRMWQTEHGRSGATSGYDELNLVESGKNYGWPIIQSQEQRAGMVTPIRSSTAEVTWAPSGIAYVEGSLFFAGLRGATLYEAVTANTGTVVGFREHLAGVYGRLRAVVLGPDGYLYVTTSNRDGRGVPRLGDDKIFRISPDMIKSIK